MASNPIGGCWSGPLTPRLSCRMCISRSDLPAGNVVCGDDQHGPTFLRARLLGRVASAGCGRLGLRQVGFGRLGRLGGAGEGQHRTFAGALAIPVVDVDGDELAGTDLLEEDLLAQLVLELPLDG